MATSVLVAASWNIQKNGRAPVGGKEHSPTPTEILAQYAPDIVFLDALDRRMSVPG
jgi:endonuclease/exonuclease/phosphatase family metal-dependent hydrolase